MRKKTTSKGGEMLSISIKEKQEYQPKQEKVISDSNEDDLDIPF